MGNTMINLSPDQQEAANKFMTFLLDPAPGEMVMQGHAGVGKSFMTTHLIELAENSSKMIKLISNVDNKLNICLTASTNKAAAVLRRMTGRDTTTIHSLLNLKVYNNWKTGETELRQVRNFDPIQNTLLVVDEASMIDSQLLDIIRSSCKSCKILYILDPYQLAPVSEDSCPVSEKVQDKVTLTTIHRQATGNPIIDLAEGYRKVLDGEHFPLITANGNEIQRVSGDVFIQMINEEFKEIDHNVDDAKILAWRNKIVNSANSHVRALHTTSEKPEIGEYMLTNKPILGTKENPGYTTDSILQIDDVSKKSIDILGVDTWIVTVGEKILYVPVDPVTLTAKIKKESRKAKAEKKKTGSANWTDYFNLVEKFADLRPVHASTVHKSQGSTHDKVFINLTDIGRNHNRAEVARLMYVAITRAAKQIILYGELGFRYNDIGE